MAEAAGLSSIFGTEPTVLESSILWTGEGAEDQVGHFDLEVTGPPSPRHNPGSVIAVTPISGNASMRIMPMDGTQYLPTREEFECRAQ